MSCYRSLVSPLLLPAEKMMQEKGKPETEQARYRGMLDTLSAKVLVLEAASPAVELEAQQR